MREVSLRPGDGADKTASIAGGMIVDWAMVMASAMSGEVVYVLSYVSHDRGLYFPMSGLVRFNFTSFGA